jgi:hypothetical protein
MGASLHRAGENMTWASKDGGMRISEYFFLVSITGSHFTHSWVWWLGKLLMSMILSFLSNVYLRTMINAPF